MQTENSSPDVDTVLNPNSTYLAQSEVNSHLKSEEAVISEDLPDMPESRETADYSEDILTIKNQEAELKKEYPNIDLGEEMEKDPFISQMLARGYDVQSIFELKYPGMAESRLMKAQRENVLKNIRTRNSRPRSMGYSGYFNYGRDIKNMSEEEILRIDAKIKRGQRVTL